jgi:hypothetical protein
MAVSIAAREAVRQRAGFACEYCGVREIDVGGLLTVDHFRPVSQRGSDELSNLLYCCHSCNVFKADHWAASSDAIPLWNPRENGAVNHFLLDSDGLLHGLTDTGAFTIGRLRLNRAPLVAHRKLRLESVHRAKEAGRYQELAGLLATLLEQEESLSMEQRDLLKEQRRLLRLLLDRSP